VILQLKNCCKPFDEGIFSVPGGSVAFHEEPRSTIVIEARDDGGARRWAQTLDVSRGDSSIYTTGSACALAEPYLFVHTYGEHDRGMTWHNHSLACFDLDGRLRWRFWAEIAESLAIRDGLLYAVSRDESRVGNESARLRLRALELATGAEVLDEDVFAPVAQMGLPPRWVLRGCRFIDRGGLHLELPALHIKVP
jgi:hypothetical protein